MNRRHAVAGLAGLVGGLAVNVSSARSADEQAAGIPGAIKLRLDEKIMLAAKSSPIKVNGSELPLVSIGTGVFSLDKESRLTATIKAAVMQYSKVEYWISLAVFDAAGKLLGTAGHKESIQYIRLGSIPTLLPDIKFDFGISKAYKDAAQVVVAISERDVPAPG